MENIELTNEEINAIKVYLDGKIEMAEIDVKTAYCSMIDKACALREELDAFKEILEREDTDLVKWFIEKLNIQL